MSDHLSADQQLAADLAEMRPCPKCGEPVHPENTGFHVCQRTSNRVVAQLYAAKSMVSNSIALRTMDAAIAEIERLSVETGRLKAQVARLAQEVEALQECK